MAVLSDYELVSTDDGSLTLRSELYGQAMHTMSGAFEEALLKHVIPSGIMNTASDSAAVLDVGFGLGYNTTALIETAALRNPPLFIDVTAFEYDSEYLKLMKQVKFEGTRQFYHMKAVEALETGISSGDHFSIRVLKGDARQSLKSLSAICFDAVFHDPFSPAKNPELWTVEFFLMLASVMKERAVLTTYSSAAQIRRAMINAGFRIGAGPSVGPKREGTLASKNPPFKTLSESEIAVIMNDPKSVPYRDSDGKTSREIITETRLRDIQALKANRSYQ